MQHSIEELTCLLVVLVLGSSWSLDNYKQLVDLNGGLIHAHNKVCETINVFRHSSKQFYHLVNFCPTDSKPTLIAKCRDICKSNDIHSIIPVFSNGKLFRNRYCAACNNVSNYTIPNIKAECKGRIPKQPLKDRCCDLSLEKGDNQTCRTDNKGASKNRNCAEYTVCRAQTFSTLISFVNNNPNHKDCNEDSCEMQFNCENDYIPHNQQCLRKSASNTSNYTVYPTTKPKAKYATCTVQGPIKLAEKHTMNLNVIGIVCYIYLITVMINKTPKNTVDTLFMGFYISLLLVESILLVTVHFKSVSCSWYLSVFLYWALLKVQAWSLLIVLTFSGS